jgi:hypothetical protein
MLNAEYVEVGNVSNELYCVLIGRVNVKFWSAENKSLYLSLINFSYSSMV